MNFFKIILPGILFLICTVCLLYVFLSGNSGTSTSFPSETEHLSPQPELLARKAEIQVDTNYLLGKFEPAHKRGFVEVDVKYSAEKKGLYLRTEAYEAFIRMHDAALQSGKKLFIVSATRNFWRQKNIWEGKWSGKTLVDGKNLAKTVSDPVERAKIILRFSAMPGTSRHHWGTDIDLNALNNKYFSKGEGKEIYIWLTENASDYGFCQVYTPKDLTRPTGYEEEKWHWSYLPLARTLLVRYNQEVTYSDLKDFSGWETARVLRVIKDYVQSINKNCK